MKSPREVCTVAVYFLVRSITVGGGVVLCSMQVTISLSQPGANEVAAPPAGPEPQAASETARVATARIRLTPRVTGMLGRKAGYPDCYERRLATGGRVRRHDGRGRRGRRIVLGRRVEDSM